MDATTSSAPEAGGIAIIGMACRLPQAPDIATFWRMLCEGREGLTRFSPAELRAAGVAEPTKPVYVPVNGMLRDVEQFDAGFFGMSPREASITDPQHRIFLELASEALEAAGHEAPGDGAAVGVYAGCGASSYLARNLWPSWRSLADVGELRLRMGNGQEYLATRLSYKLNLKGPSISVNTACSTSLVAVHLACEGLTGFQCDIALAGGISIQLPQVKGYQHEPGGILSPDGHCRAFDAAAQGTVSGNGGAVVVLRRLEDALDAGDTIYAVIRGSAINNDGSDKAGYTAPSGNAQRKVIQEAQQVAGVDPGTIGYVEAHGTATPLGDPIEFAALTEAFRSRTDAVQYCALGSLKTNFGHLDEAAGVAGLIKAALCLHRRAIPPSLHFERPNPELAYASSPFFVSAELRPFAAPEDGAPRRAAVSSFGIGGTNAHAVLEEAPAAIAPPARRKVQLLTVSAATREACARRCEGLAAWLADQQQGPALADVAHTLQVGRRAFPFRTSVIAVDRDAAIAGLRQAQGRVAAKDAPPVVFMFSGQGTQYPGMAAGLYGTEPTFRRVLDRCAETLLAPLGIDIRALLVEGGDTAGAELRQTQFAQPALFAVEYALAQLWLDWGVRPAALIGHSLGEYVALCLAGVMELDTALGIVARRGRLMQAAPAGAMLAVPLGAQAVRADLDAGIEIAAVNAPDRCSLAGPVPAIEACAERLRAVGVATTRLSVSHAFHSRSMANAATSLAGHVTGCALQAPRIRVISNVSGDWLGDAEATDAGYYARQLRAPVQFAAGVQCLLRDMPDAVLLEVGPGSALVQAARRCGAANVLASLPPAGDGQVAHRTLLASLGILWEQGVAVDWEEFAEPGRRRVPLPTYPFAREPHWIEPPAASSHAVAEPGPATPAGAPRWCYRPAWRMQEAAETPAPSGHFLLLADDGADAVLTKILRAAGCRVSHVRRGDRFAITGAASFTVDPASSDDFRQVLDALPEPPRQVVMLWSHGRATGWRAEYWCVCLLALMQALDAAAPDAGLAAAVSGLGAVVPGDGRALDPEKGTLPGLLRSAALEFPDRVIRLLDLPEGAADDHLAMRALAGFCDQAAADGMQAWRDGRFWSLDHVSAGAPDGRGVTLRRGGTYLVTGGLGGIGLSLAEMLARTHDARIVLLGRTAPPPPAHWPELLADPATPPGLRHRLETLRRMQENGVQMLIRAADVADPAALAAVVAAARDRFGALHGVIHAAGVADGALLAGRSAADMAAVLAPKIAGLRALVDVLHADKLDFLLLCSALSAETGAPGQAAYCAANSFLDHFAEAGAAPWPVLSVAWDAWRDVGMAAWTAPARARGLHMRRQPNGGARFTVALSAAHDWVLAEHRIGAHSVLPGTAYLDFAASALRDFTGAHAVEFRDVDFVQPLALDRDQTVELAIALEPQDAGFGFSITTQDAGGVERLHAQGYLAAIAVTTNDPVPQETGQTPASDPAFAVRLDAFGPHWRCAVAFTGPDRDTADIALPAAFAAEAGPLHMLHPALLDVATGFTVLDRHYDAALLPSGYRRLRLYRPLPARLCSHVAAVRARPDGLELDLALHDPSGTLLAEIEGYHLRRTGELGAATTVRLTQAVPGQLDSLQLTPCERPAPPEGAVEIAVQAAGVNFKEVLFATGLLPAAEAGDWQFGLECAGRISRVGALVQDFAVGDAVVAYAAGSLASHTLAPVAQVQKIPAGLSFAEAATLPAAFVTAWHALVEVGRLRAGETALIHAAAGGVGLAATQIALGLGARVLATAGSDTKRDMLMQLGVAATFSSRDSGFVAGVQAATGGRGADVVLNSLSGELMRGSLDCLAPFGRFLELGVRDIYGGGSLDLARFARAISFSAVSVGPGMPGFAELFAGVVRKAESGTLRPLPHRVFPIARAGDAFAHMAGARHVGKVVIAVGGEAETVPAATSEAGGLTVSAGIALFEHGLSLGLPRLLVSTRDPGQRREAQQRAVDRQPAPAEPLPTEGSVADRLALVLGRLLGIAAIDPQADFFALGGDSLIGAQFVAQASRLLGLRVTLRDLFDAPTITALAARVTAGGAAASETIPVAAPRTHYPLSHAQQRLWILAHNLAASIAYNMSYTLSLTGTLDTAALERAFAHVLERHEALRTAFVSVQGTPCTVVRDVTRFSLPVHDLTGEADPESIAGRAIRAEAMAPIALDQPPLLRAQLLRLAPQEHLLLVSLHHIVGDGMSLNALMRDLDHFYAAFAAGQTPSLPPLPIQYKDFAVWQRERTASGALQEDRAYWLGRLAGELPVLHLPTDRQRGKAQAFDGGQIVLQLPVLPTEQLRTLCQARGATLFMVLVAALQVVLHQASGDAEIVLGTPVAGRERAELQEQIGYYLNNVVLRGNVRRGETFVHLLDRVRVTVSEALAHQDYPFDLLIEEMAVVTEPGRSPLFDVQINLMPGETPRLQIGGLEVGGFVTNSGTTMFDLNFMFSDGAQGLMLEIAYSTALFEPPTVAAMGERVLRVLTEIGTDAGSSVRTLCEQIAARGDAAERQAFLAASLDLDEEF